jgi:hypothetical protein
VIVVVVVVVIVVVVAAVAAVAAVAVVVVLTNGIVYRMVLVSVFVKMMGFKSLEILYTTQKKNV